MQDYVTFEQPNGTFSKLSSWWLMLANVSKYWIDIYCGIGITESLMTLFLMPLLVLCLSMLQIKMSMACQCPHLNPHHLILLQQNSKWNSCFLNKIICCLWTWKPVTLVVCRIRICLSVTGYMSMCRDKCLIHKTMNEDIPINPDVAHTCSKARVLWCRP